jgi:hypothetical protein
MTRISRYVTIGVIAAFGLAAAGHTASADQTEPLTIALSVRDGAQVPSGVLTQAQSDVTRIYRQAGVEIVWLATPSLLSDTDPDCGSRLIIAILSRDQVRRLNPALMRSEVGVALSSPTRRGRVAYVFYHRVEHLTGGNGFNLAPVLGIAMAHEIGHLLLPENAHSQIGLMGAKWTKADLRLAQGSQLFFTAKQGELIRTRLTQANESVSTVR